MAPDDRHEGTVPAGAGDAPAAIVLAAGAGRRLGLGPKAWLSSRGITLAERAVRVCAAAGLRPVLVRAFNVLRQYPEAAVAAHWDLLRSRLHPGGVVVDGTCDEIGRRSAWITLDNDGPVSLTLSLNFGAFARPSDVAERLPKALIHRNVPGEAVHRYLQAFDRGWDEAAALAAFGRRQRFVAACGAMRDAGWPLLDSPSRWRIGEVTVAWEAVAPTP